MDHQQLKRLGVVVVFICSCMGDFAGAGEKVAMVRVPGGGIQPQAVVDDRGGLHLLYYKGGVRSGDLYYAKQEVGKGSFSHAVRVNSHAGSAVAMGTIRGGKMALGRNNRVHVAWNGSSKIIETLGGDTHRHEGRHLMFYTRQKESGKGFEPERDVSRYSFGLDGGGSVAADAKGNVYVVWAGNDSHEGPGEGKRVIYVAASEDEGASFAREVRANVERTGACACCSLDAFADRDGKLYVLYRGAQDLVNRDTYVLVSEDGGGSFQSRLLDRWQLKICPASSYFMTQGAGGVFAALESKRKVYYVQLDQANAPLRMSGESELPGKHPSMAVNQAGEKLLVWTEGLGWGGQRDLVWELYDSSGKVIEPRKTRKKAVPAWSFAAAVAKGTDGFLIIY